MHAIKYMYRSWILPLQGVWVQSSLPADFALRKPVAPPGGQAGLEPHAARARGQSQPLSLIMWLSSMMYFPSLYFWLLSKACS